MEKTVRPETYRTKRKSTKKEGESGYLYITKKIRVEYSKGTSGKLEVRVEEDTSHTNVDTNGGTDRR